jgi:hypothetical protein
MAAQKCSIAGGSDHGYDLGNPFTNGDDIKHIMHALKMLKPGGRLVAICANGPRQNDKLRPLVEARGGIWEELPSDTFIGAGTGVRTVLLMLDA